LIDLFIDWHAGSTTGIAHADDLDPIQGQGHGAFEVLKTCEAVHAGGDERQPPCGAFWLQQAGSSR